MIEADDIIGLADAIAADLNAGEFTPRLRAERAYRPIMELDELAHATVLVVPRGEDGQIFTRKNWKFQTSVDIGVLRKLPTMVSEAKDRELLDELMELVRMIKRGFRAGPAPSNTPHRLVTLENNPIYRPDWLDSRQFVSVITATYQAAGV